MPAKTATSVPASPTDSGKHPVDQMLPPGKLAVYGFQHVLAFYAGAVVVPLLLASAIGLGQQQLVYLINADLFTCGIASIIQSIGFWKIGVRLPLLQGVTFTAVAPMIAIATGAGGGVAGLLAVYGAVIVAGAITFFMAPFFSQLVRFFPPVVTGTVITVIGLALLPVAAEQAAGGDTEAADFGSLRNIAYAAGTLLLIILIYRFFRGFLSTVAVLLSLVVGTGAAAALGDADFSGVADASWLGITTPFHFGWPTFNAGAIVAMTIVMLITAVETTGDVFATGEIVGKRIQRRDIARALRADGLATTIGGILNSFPYTCFAENVGLVRLTRVKSRYVVATAGVFMLALGLLPKIGALVAAIPHPVLGGAALALFGTVAVVGIQTLGRVDFHDDRNVVIVAVSLALALIPVGVPSFYDEVPQGVQIVVGSGITMGSLSAIALNLLFNVAVRRPSPAPDVAAEKLTVADVNAMSDAEFERRFSRLFQGGDWIVREAAGSRPFDGLYAMRHAFHSRLFDASTWRQLELLRSYPDVAGATTAEGALGTESMRDQSAAGLDQLSPEEYGEFRAVDDAYRREFAFPLIICVREHTKDTLLASARGRLHNPPAQEKASALVEIAKIANLRLLDLVTTGEHDGDRALSAQ